VIKIYNLLNKMILLFFLIICLSLTFSSLKWVTKMDFHTFQEGTMIVSRNPFIVLIILIAMSFMFLLLLNIVRKKNTSCAMLCGLIVIHVILSFFWIMNNTYPLELDQRNVWEAAVALESGNELSDSAYFYHYPFQSGMVYVMKAVIHMTGITNPFVWKVFNIIAIALFDLGIFLLNNEVFHEKNKVLNAIFPVLLLGFFPLVLYSSFVYGTLISITLVTWSFVGVAKSVNGKKKYWAILPILLMPIANRVYSGTLIATVAIVVISVIEALFSKGKKRFVLLMVSVLVICTSFLSGVVIRRMFYQQTGVDYRNSGVPATAYIYMGTATDNGVAGPGSYTEVAVELYDSYGEDTTKEALNRDVQTFNEYISGERDLSFFIEKIRYQWLDPYFGGLTMTCHYFGRFVVEESFEQFLSSDFFGNVYKYWLKYYIPFIYLLAFVGSIFLIFVKRVSILSCLYSIYFIGGFIFQLIWESKSRYCFAYFLFLIPMAAYGLIAFDEFLFRRKLSFNLDKKKIRTFQYTLIVIQLFIMFVNIIGFNWENNDFVISDFYSSHTREALLYTDSSFEDEMRDIVSDSCRINKGYYTIEATYSSNFLPEEKHGAAIYPMIVSDGYEYCLTDEYVFMDEKGKLSFEVYVPFNNSELEVHALLGDDRELLTVDNETKYILMDQITISKNRTRSILVNFVSLIIIMAFVDILLFHYLRECYEK